METVERPSKLQKRGHSPENEEAQFAQMPSDLNGVDQQASENVDESGTVLNAGSTETADLTLEKAPPADQEGCGQETTPQANEQPATQSATGEDGAKPMSKNQLKKLRRQQEWEAGREDRKAKRREKGKAKRIKQQEEKAAAAARASSSDNVGSPTTIAPSVSQPPPKAPVQLPITFLFDCDFDGLMMDHELKSLGNQLTRCYSDVKKANFRAHMALASFGGKLQERFDGLLNGQHRSWKGVRFFSEDFVYVAERASEWMKEKNGGRIDGALTQSQTAASEEAGEIVYLTSDSDETLTELKPYSTYIIGGLVDHNRHKGICYKRAQDRSVRTAKLPIGSFLQMNSRKVLATNHVNEIMLKWLECGDWAKAFMEVIPKRKGGALKANSDGSGQITKNGDTEEDGAGEGGNTQAEQEKVTGGCEDPPAPKEGSSKTTSQHE